MTNPGASLAISEAPFTTPVRTDVAPRAPRATQSRAGSFFYFMFFKYLVNLAH